MRAIRFDGLAVHADARNKEDDMNSASLDSLTAIVSRKYRRAHIARIAPDSGRPRADWITWGCKWRYGHSEFDVARPSTTAPKQRCRVCWRSVQFTAGAEVTVALSDASSASDAAEQVRDSACG